MPDIKLPDGSIRSFANPVTIAEVAASIGAGLARAALAGKVDGALVDTSYLIERNADLAIITERDAEGLDLIRHSTAHLLAYAVKELFPEAQVTIGPVIENGFYYDFAYKRPFTPEDLAAIEKRMAELAKKDIPVSREVWNARRCGQVLPRSRREIQGRTDRRHSGRPAGVALSRRRFHRPLPRPARADHGQAEGLQADEGGRRLLARRSPQRAVAAHLRHGLGEEGRPRRLPAHARRGREARPSPPGQAVRPVPHAGRGAGPGLLAPQGLGDLAGNRAVHARRLSQQRLPGSALPADSRQDACGKSRATGSTTRTTCSRPRRKTATTRSSR